MSGKKSLPTKPAPHTFSTQAPTNTIHSIPNQEQAKREFLILIEDVEKYISSLKSIAKKLSQIDERDEIIDAMFGESDWSPFHAGLRITYAYQDLVQLKYKIFVFKQEVKAQGMSDPQVQMEKLQNIFKGAAQADLGIQIPYKENIQDGKLKSAEDLRHENAAKNKNHTLRDIIVEKFVSFVNRVKSLFGFSESYKKELLGKLYTIKEPTIKPNKSSKLQ
jgi:hypothetical protein